MINLVLKLILLMTFIITVLIKEKENTVFLSGRTQYTETLFVKIFFRKEDLIIVDKFKGKFGMNFFRVIFEIKNKNYICNIITTKELFSEKLIGDRI